MTILEIDKFYKKIIIKSGNQNNYHICKQGRNYIQKWQQEHLNAG